MFGGVAWAVEAEKQLALTGVKWRKAETTRLELHCVRGMRQFVPERSSAPMGCVR